MILTLNRYGSTPMGTFGELIVGGLRLYSCEDPWLDNAFNRSCVPAGFYPLEAFNSTAHRKCFILRNTDPRTAILIHSGNTNRDTAGCILPGTRLGALREDWAVLGSRAAMELLNDLKPDGINIKWEVNL